MHVVTCQLNHSCTYVGVVMLRDFHIDSCAVSNVDYSIEYRNSTVSTLATSSILSHHVELLNEKDEASN